MRVSDLAAALDQIAPLALAEDWDNVGLLIGSPDAEVSAVLTCLTLTAEVAAEAIARGAQLVVTHHPVLFRAVRRLTDETPEGRMLLELIRAGVSVYSPHTGYDSAREGINQQLAESLGLTGLRPLRPVPVRPASGPASGCPASRPASGPDESVNEAAVGAAVGGGRYGDLPDAVPLSELVQRVKQVVHVERTWFVGDPARLVRRVAVACGSAVEYLPDAAAAHCEVLLTGEARFHACLEARAAGIALILPGHYATERPAMEALARTLSARFPALTVQSSQAESDPLDWT